MKHLNQFFALVATAIISISSSNLSAATRTWTGATSTNWSTSSNWSNNSVPGSTDNAIIPANVSSGRYPVLTANARVDNFTLNGGTFSTANFNLIVDNNLIVNDGTFNSGTGTITSDNIDINNGTFIIQGNRLNLGNNFTIDGGTVEVTGADFEIDDDFFFLSGTLDMNGYDMIISDNYTYQGGSLSNPGDLITANDVFVNFSGTHLMGIDLRVLATMTFTNGIILTTPDNFITFDNDATVSSASASSHVNGPVRKEISTSTTPNFTFPSGDGVIYAPITISNIASRRNEDYFTAYYVNERHPNAGGTKGSGLNLVSQAEYWILDRAATSGTPTTEAVVTLNYNSSRSGSITNAGVLRVARWDGSQSQWVDQGRSSSSSNGTSGNLISSGAVSSFSPFTLGSSTNVNPLPLVLLNFNAKAIANNIEVKWATTSEINNDFFTLEKSTNGSEWSNIATIKGAGNSEVLTNYNFLDVNPVNGTQFYRLKQTDVNGDFTYSAIVAVTFGQSQLNNTLSMYPIPASTVLNIQSSMDLSAGAVVNVYNAQGRMVMTLHANESNLAIDIQNLESGIYFVEINAGSEIVKSKFQKL